MHMSKTILAVGAVTLGLLASSAVAKDTEDDAKLREALHEKMSDLSGTSKKKPEQATPAKAPAKTAVPAKTAAPAQPAPPPATKSEAPAPKPKPAPEATAAPVAASATTEEPALAPVSEDSPEAAKMREALHKRLAEEAVNPTPYVEVKPAPEVKETTPAEETASEASLVAPALPISNSKEQRLQQLLEQYKADEITPLEYHTQRAKIIAE